MQNQQDFKYLEQYYNSPYGADKRRQKLINEHLAEEVEPFRYLFETGVAQEIIKDLPISTLCALTFGPIISLVNDQIAGFVEVDEKTTNDLAEACWDAVKR